MKPSESVARLPAIALELAFAVALTACVAFPAQAQPVQTAGRIPTVTRLVKIFYELETGLTSNLVAHNARAVDQALDPDFEMRTGSVPGTPVPRADWMRQAQSNPSEVSIDQMAVHDFGGVAVVSFRQVPAAAQSTGTTQSLFIVDCWKRDGEHWKLATRYLSNAAAPASAMPPSAGTVDKRY